jgi:hypothetical protein
MTPRHSSSPASRWRNNGLSIVLFILFAVSLVGQSYAGWKNFNEEQRQHDQPLIGYGEFIRSPDFGETVFENWESEFLQMTFYVLLTVFLYQKGSSESKKPDGVESVEEDPLEHRDEPGVPGPVRKGGWQLTVYKNSLSLALGVLFLLSLLGHAAAGARKYSEEQITHAAGDEVGVAEYMTTSRFWYESFQNWQSEFLAVLAIVVLSVWLRQWGSPESKPVHAAHSQTGAE